MKIKKFISKIKQTSRLTKGLVATAVAIGLFSSAALAGYTPADRAVFDWNKAADHKGSLDGPRLNAFINTPYYGDERAFFDARMQENTATTAYDDVLQNVTQGSKKVVLRTYVHNGANQDTNASGKGVAKDTKVRIDLPTGASQALRARSYISISNPAPGYPAEVTDTTELVDSRGFTLDYVEGSAKIYSSGAVNGQTLSDNVVGSGVLIGYDSLNGQLPGCFDYQTFVEITVEIKSAESAVSKVVRKAGTTTYGESTTVAPGDKVQWMLRYDNKGQSPQTNVQMFDALPEHLQVNPASVRYIYRDASGTDRDIVISDTDLFTKWVDFGTWSPNTWFFIRFDTTALSDFEGCEVTLTNQVRNKTTQLPAELRDNAQVTIKKNNCNPVTPQYSCDLLTATRVGSGREYRFTANASATNGASIQRYVFTYGDGQTETVTTNTANHTYAQDGKYNANVKVDMLVNGQTVTVGGNNGCVVALDINTVTPSYSCDLLTIQKTGGRSIKATLNGSAAGGATISKYVFSFDDGSNPQEFNTNTANYTYAKDGNYQVKGQVLVQVNGQPIWVDDVNCVANVEFVTVNPKYSCDLVTVEKTEGRTVKVKAKATATNGASIKRYVYTFGDGSAEFVTDKDEVTHTYGKDGQYPIRAKVQIAVGNETVTAESDACAASVNYTTTPTTPVTPGKLPETGAGNVIAAFLAVTGVSTLGYAIFGRRLV